MRPGRRHHPLHIRLRHGQVRPQLRRAGIARRRINRRHPGGTRQPPRQRVLPSPGTHHQNTHQAGPPATPTQ